MKAIIYPIDILCLTYWRLDYLKVYIELLHLSTDFPFKLRIINNADNDEETKSFILKMEKCGLVHSHLFNKENQPLAMALTTGFNYWKEDLGKFIMTSPNDIFPPLFKKPDWLEVFHDRMNYDDQPGCISFKGCRGTYDGFIRKTRPWIEKRVNEIGGKLLEKYNRNKKLIYE